MLASLTDDDTKLDEVSLEVLAHIWKSKNSSSAQAFCWKLIQTCLPTRVHLAKFRIIEGRHNIVCPLWFIKEKDETHLFIECTITPHLWHEVTSWLGIISVIVIWFEASSKNMWSFLGTCLLDHLEGQE